MIDPETRVNMNGSPSKDSELPTSHRPAISVCMAAYNGARFISLQIQSILRQLAPTDEIVVVDDHSTDETRETVRALADNRIRLLEHPNNMGVSRSFEDAIRAASNHILFLSDQDDLWADDKVDTIMKAFATNPEVTLIATDTALIDEHGTLLSSSYFAPRGEFHPGFWQNLLRNRFGGCTLAFRSEIIPEILPFPHNYDVLHDVWIGIRNSLADHQTLYIDKPLVLNRRHASTATGRRQLSLSRKIGTRLHLLLALVSFSLRKEAAKLRPDKPL